MFDDLYEAHRTSLHAYFLGRTADPELALDLLQELFLRVWRSMQTMEALPAEKRHYWLYSIARNLVVDAYRRRGAFSSAETRLASLAAPPPAAAAEHEAVERHAIAELDAAINRLPEDLRVVLLLSVLGERNSSEIGEILGRPPGTVRYQLAQARRQLASEMQLAADVN